MILFIFVMLMFFVMFYNDIMYHNYNINHTKIYHIDVNELIQEYNRSRIDFHHKIEPKIAYK
jgi:hypothetical protein